MLAPAMACCPALLTAAPRRRRGGLSAAGAPGSLLAAAPPRPPFPQALPQFLELRSRRLQFLFQPLLSLYRLAMHSAVIARLPALLYYLAPQLGYLAPACRRAAFHTSPESSHTSFLSTPFRLCPELPHRYTEYLLLRGLTIERPNQVWCADITYIPVQGGFLYLVAIMDWASRRVLAWRLSNTMDTEFCLAALAEALEGYGIPEIFNTDQGSQFTSIAFTGLLETTGIRCSMDGRGRCLDNVFIERLWRSLKYEAVYLHDLEDGFKAQRVIGEWMEFYNEQRPHSALAGRTPEEAYRDGAAKREEGVA